MYKIGKAQGEENRQKGINVILGPCVNMMRNPKAGRVWEAFGDDPYYTGICSSQIVKGIQDSGVIACLKHYVGNDQETYRAASSSNIQMNALMDIYIEPFYRVIHDAEVGSIMAAYNAVNNSYCYENKFLLTDILRGILNFRGFVMTDWWSIHNDDPINLNSGIDMNMPGGKYSGFLNETVGRDKSYWSNLEKQIKENKVKEERINEAATRIIAAMYQMNQMENFPNVNMFYPTNTEEKKKLQRKVATESQVLLKNDGILPLKIKNISKLAVIGNDAFDRDCEPDNLPDCLNKTNKVVNGHVPLGYGSGAIDFGYLVTPLEGITNLAKKYNIKVLSSGKLIYKDKKKLKNVVHISAEEDIEKGVSVAKEADVVIVFAKAISGEGNTRVENTIGDRGNLDLLHNANKLIEKIAEVNKNIIVVINAPATVNLPWIDKVKAVIFSGFPGSESGNAIADILFGEVNPSGHLPFVWGKDEQYAGQIEFLENITIINKATGKTWRDIYRYIGIDCYANPDNRPGHDKEQYNYTEGLYIGQRWFNKLNIKPLFPFGFGLSYTTFEYSDLNITMDINGLTAKFKIKNTGLITGKAVSMMFLTFPDNIGDYPPYILKGFEKIEIKSGQTEIIKIIADEHALSYFSIEKNKYIRVNNGIIKVAISDNGDPSQAKLSGEIDAKY